MIDEGDLVALAVGRGASHAAVLATSEIRFHEEFRKACEKNICGKYGTSWMGPPAIGPIDALIKRACGYERGLLFQTEHRVAGSFDMKGMLAAAKIHEAVFRKLLEKMRQAYPEENLLSLSAGCCSICPSCAYLDNAPCRNPDQAVSSVEAYGINVAALQKSSGLPCYGGKNTVTFVGLILFNYRKTD
jgi:predicted metal-binding protein